MGDEEIEVTLVRHAEKLDLLGGKVRTLESQVDYFENRVAELASLVERQKIMLVAMANTR